MRSAIDKFDTFHDCIDESLGNARGHGRLLEFSEFGDCFDMAFVPSIYIKITIVPKYLNIFSSNNLIFLEMVINNGTEVLCSATDI